MDPPISPLPPFNARANRSAYPFPPANMGASGSRASGDESSSTSGESSSGTSSSESPSNLGLNRGELAGSQYLLGDATEYPPLMNACEDNWSWNPKDKSHEVKLHGPKHRIAHFHPNWSNGTAGVRGTRMLNRGRFYWEINVSQRIFGTR